MGKRLENALRRDHSILEAATKLFAEQGFEATKMTAVSKLAGVAVGTIYLRYPNKSALLAGVLDQFEEKFVQALRDPKVHEAPWPTRFQAIFGAMMATAQSSPELPAIMRLTAHGASANFQPGESVRREIADIIRLAQEEEAFRPDIDPTLASAIAYGMVDGAMKHLMFQPETAPQRVIENLAEASARWLMNDTAAEA